MEGYAYFCLTIEDVSRYRIFRALKQKSEAAAELRKILSTANIELRQSHGQRVKQVTIDGGRDWGLTSFQEFAADQNIEVIVSAPDNQYQNGVSERSIRFVQDAARCCSIQMKVPSVFWNHMLDMACHTLNCSSQSSVDDRKTPWEVYWSTFNPSKRVARVDYLWIPGSLCIAHVEASHRVAGEKLDARGTRCVFLGYRGTKNKLVWLLDGGRFLITPQVVAHESVGYGHGWPADPREIVRSLPKHVQDRLKSRKTDYARNEDFNIARESPPTTLVPRGRGRPKRTIQRPYEDQVMLHLDAPTCVDEDLIAILNNMTLKSDENFGNQVTTKCSSVDLELLNDEVPTNILSQIQYTIHSQIHSQNSDGDDLFRILTNFSEAKTCLVASAKDEPTYRQAITCAEKKEWIDAMFVEIDDCLNRNTFKFVDRNNLTRKGRLVTSKWVLKKKYKPNMVLDKYKARVVARGFTQTKGVDFNETSSTTARSASWRILMALAALNEWYILQADFIAAYLAGELKEQIFMEQFPQLAEYFEAHPELASKLGYSRECVIELQKPLYGLRQSGACWQEKVREIMGKKGYKPLISDNAIYRNVNTKIIVASYVDDFLLIGPDRSLLQSLTNSLNEEVSLNDLGDANWFLGVRIRRSSPTGNVRLDLEQYLERSIQELGIDNDNLSKTPMSTNSKIDMRKFKGKASEKEIYEFQKLVGKFNFSSCILRCDTAQATSLMARYMCNPSPQHHQHMLRVPRYLSSCLSRSLLYRKDHKHRIDFGEYGLHCAVDSSFADDFDSAKSTTGYVIFMAGCPVVWRSKLQSTVSTLTCEAEYAAIFEAVKECAWIRNFLSELDQMPTGPIPILEDNTGAIKWAKDDGMTSGRRHVRIEYHYSVEESRNGNVDVRQISSAQNAADGFTKPLGSEQFSRFIQQLGLYDDNTAL